MNQNCKDCLFFTQAQGLYGFCRRMPPQVVSSTERDSANGFDTTEITTHWPKVEYGEWCGEFLDKGKAQFGLKRLEEIGKEIGMHNVL